MHLEIKQTKLAPETVDSAVVNKLYDLYHNRQSGDTFDLQGYIKTGAVFRNVETELETAFQDLEIEPADYYMTFEDSEVERVLKLNMGKDESEGITASEAAATNLETIFKNNTDIELFDEFKYFMTPGKALSKQAFYHCSNLKRIDLSNCTSYPDDAFNGLTNLEYTGGAGSPQGVIIIPEGTTSIGGWGNFIGCAKITSVILPDSLTYIQGNNFQQMAALTEITVGTGMTRWVRGNFYNCPNFNKVNIKDLDAWLNITFESTGNAETPLAVARHLYLNGAEITSADFTGKTIIKDKVLWGCLGLTSVVLPSTITSIGSSAFRSCDNLVIPDLNLPNLTVLGSYAFAGTKLQTVSNLGAANLSEGCFQYCYQLTNAPIPINSTSIPSRCFQNCTSITNVSIPSNIVSVGEHAFNGCTALKGTVLDLSTFTNLHSVGSYALSSFSLTGVYDSGLFNAVSLGNHPFGTDLQNVELILRDNVTGFDRAYMSNLHTPRLTLGMSTIKGDCFYGLNQGDTLPCELILLNTVTTIEQKTFQHANIASPFVIPSSVTSMESYSLGLGNTACTIKFESSTPPTFSQRVFCRDGEQEPRISKILVPSGSRQAYLDALHVNQQGTQWSDSLVEEYIPTT